MTKINNTNPRKLKHNTDIQVRFNDIDIAGHVNNAVHQYYYDYARMQYFNEVFEKINWREEGLVLVNINVDYISPIYIDDKVQVKTSIIKTGNKSVKMIQIIHCADNPERVFSKSCSVLVGYHFIKNKSFKIPEKWKNSIHKYEGTSENIN